MGEIEKLNKKKGLDIIEIYVARKTTVQDDDGNFEHLFGSSEVCKDLSDTAPDGRRLVVTGIRQELEEELNVCHKLFKKRFGKKTKVESPSIEGPHVVQKNDVLPDGNEADDWEPWRSGKKGEKAPTKTHPILDAYLETMNFFSPVNYPCTDEKKYFKFRRGDEWINRVLKGSK